MKKIRNKEINMFTINAYMKMSPAEKLKLLEENIKFFKKITPAVNKKIWEKLKKKGF
jgi:hypothetical protein